MEPVWYCHRLVLGTWDMPERKRLLQHGLHWCKKQKQKLSHSRSDHSSLYATDTGVGCEAVPHNDNLPKKTHSSQWTVSKTQGLGKKEKTLKGLVEMNVRLREKVPPPMWWKEDRQLAVRDIVKISVQKAWDSCGSDTTWRERYGNHSCQTQTDKYHGYF